MYREYCGLTRYVYFFSNKRKTVTFDSGKTMAVVTCGASGHNIRCRPSLKAAVVGMLALGNTVTIQDYVSFFFFCQYSIL